jgi:predicted transcriptional regulator
LHQGITNVILGSVKTAISVPDEIFRRATRYAKRLGISRSELFTRAVEEFLEEQRSREILASYDRAFGADAGDDDSGEFRRSGVQKALLDVEW